MLDIINLTFSYGQQTIIDHLNLSLDSDLSAVNVLLGPSGCGKTTLLNLMARLRFPSDGELRWKGIDIQGLSFIFQKPRLLPWFTVAQNISYVLESSLSSKEKKQRVKEALKLVNLSSSEHKFPHQLSGGMEQRVNIARAFAVSPQLVLMDEPFKGLDIKTKTILIDYIKTFLFNKGVGGLLVTHDVREALLLADNIYLLNGPPLSVIKEYKNPCHREERSFDNPRFLEAEASLYRCLL